MPLYICDDCDSKFEISNRSFLGSLIGGECCSSHTGITQLCETCYKIYKETSYFCPKDTHFQNVFFD